MGLPIFFADRDDMRFQPHHRAETQLRIRPDDLNPCRMNFVARSSSL